jgi:putative endonuclease
MSRFLKFIHKVCLNSKLFGAKVSIMGFIRPAKDKVGRWGEAVAKQRVIAGGLVPIATNWRCRYGELDLIALDGRILVVVEVKTRHISQREHYPGLAAVDSDKRERLARLGRNFMRNQGPFCRRNAIKARRTDAIEVYYSRAQGWRRVFGSLKAVRVEWHRGLG